MRKNRDAFILVSLTHYFSAFSDTEVKDPSKGALLLNALDLWSKDVVSILVWNERIDVGCPLRLDLEVVVQAIVREMHPPVAPVRGHQFRLQL